MEMLATLAANTTLAQTMNTLRTTTYATTTSDLSLPHEQAR